MAEEKAVAVSRDAGEIVVAGDTTVAVGRRILPQAADADMQRGFLNLLSGRRHHVLSAVAVIDGQGRMRSRICDSIVRFKRLSAEEIESYIDSGEGLGKAGGYEYAYNAQISVDADLQIIVGQHVSQQANDQQEVEPALQTLQETAGR
jgi:septum formation protein